METIEFLSLKLAGQTFNVETLIVAWWILGLASIVFIVAGRKFAEVPGHFQSVMESVFDFFDRQSVDMIGPEGKTYTPVVFFIFLVVFLFNIAGILPVDFKVGKMFVLMPPTRDVNTTLALALFSFIIYNYYGLRKKGIGFFAHFIEPVPEIAKAFSGPAKWIAVSILTPFFIMLNTVEMGARVLSLTVRLFCNILSDHIIFGALVMFALIIMKLILAAGILTFLLPCFVYLLGALTAGIQAFIFSVLTLTYIAGVVAGHEGEEAH